MEEFWKEAQYAITSSMGENLVTSCEKVYRRKKK